MSKSTLRCFNKSIYDLMGRYRNDFSHTTFNDRTRRLVAMGKELSQLGFAPQDIANIKQKHVDKLVGHWKENSVSIGSIKNRMSDLRFICKKLNRQAVVKPNDDYHIGKRSYIPENNKAIHSPNFDDIKDEYIKCSVELQRVFGLRREECLKIIPSQADNDNLLRLQASWTKGGIERTIPIRTDEQRYWLNKAKILAGDNGSLIPEKKSYIQQRRYYDRVTQEAGLKNLHGLRHAYAQQRYTEITGNQPPINGGRSRSELSIDERRVDQAARKKIASELGHSRAAIAKNYIG